MAAPLRTQAFELRLVMLMQVDKLLGPGNQYVTAAKMLLQNSEAMVSIDMPAGPSEVLVIADAHASPAFVAADLLSQAEHGPDSQVAYPYIETHACCAAEASGCICGAAWWVSSLYTLQWGLR